jgi:hypothetical protein
LTSTIQRPTTRTRSLIASRALVVAATVLAAALAWVVIVPLLGTDISVPKGPNSSERTDLVLGPVVFMTTMASLAGWALLTVLERFTTRSRTIWTAIAIVVLAVTMPWDSEFTSSERLALAVMHLVVGVVLIGGFWRTGPSQRATEG